MDLYIKIENILNMKNNKDNYYKKTSFIRLVNFLDRKIEESNLMMHGMFLRKINEHDQDLKKIDPSGLAIDSKDKELLNDLKEESENIYNNQLNFITRAINSNKNKETMEEIMIICESLYKMINKSDISFDGIKFEKYIELSKVSSDTVMNSIDIIKKIMSVYDFINNYKREDKPTGYIYALYAISNDPNLNARIYGLEINVKTRSFMNDREDVKKAEKEILTKHRRGKVSGKGKHLRIITRQDVGASVPSQGFEAAGKEIKARSLEEQKRETSFYRR